MHIIIHAVTLSKPRVDTETGSVVFDASVPVSGLNGGDLAAVAELIKELRPGERDPKTKEPVDGEIDATVAFLVTREDSHELPPSIRDEFMSRVRQIAPARALEELAELRGPKNRS